MHRLTRTKRIQLCLAGVIAAGLTAGLLWGIDLQATHPALAALVTGLFAINALAMAGSAVTAVLGDARIKPPSRASHPDAAPGHCAILWLICGEDPKRVAGRVQSFLGDLARTGQRDDCTVFVLSDTTGAEALAHEGAALAPLMDRIIYRNRARPTGRKPGNLRDWLDQFGSGYDTMLVLDADSGFSARRLRMMRAQMAAEPQLGLLQSAIRLRPAQSRFARLQRLSARLCGPVFVRGLARLSGDAGNYWGHNALIRVGAFRQAAQLPDLPGRAPWGGPVLSHDFIEAACLRRAGWKVRIDPDSRGSFEDLPESIAAHLRRDRRWAQGNLQHLRLIAAPGLHPASRLHLAAGIQSYLSAPIWLALVLLFGSGAVHATVWALLPLMAVLGLLMVPKLAGVLSASPRTRRQRAVLWRAFGAELVLSTLFAPLAMLRRTGFVGAVLCGRDSGWHVSGGQVVPSRTAPVVYVIAALAVMGAVMIPQAVIGQNMHAALLAGVMVLPITLPLALAPWLLPWFDAVPIRAGTTAIERYYDASTRRFLVMGGSGQALAIHRPLWAEGVFSPEAAAGHVNTLVAQAAEAALGRAPQRVRDLGCGVGGSLFHLAQTWPKAQLDGLTLSAAQVQIAQAHAGARGLERRVQVTQSDFSLPSLLPRADLVLAIESHVHSESAASFIRAAKRHLRAGGVLIVVDDMLAHGPLPADARNKRLIDAFRRGWHLGHVSPSATLVAEAEAQGFAAVAVTDLTPMLRLDRWRDRALRVAGPVADALGLGRMPLFANMIGGNALTEAYRAGIMRYRLVVLHLVEGREQPLPAQSAA